MKKKRYTTEQIIGVLREVDASGNMSDVCRKHGIAKTTIYAWKARFGDMSVPDAKRLMELEQENAKLKRLLGEAELDKAALKDLLGRKW
jgi:putative transposase